MGVRVRDNGLKSQKGLFVTGCSFGAERLSLGVGEDRSGWKPLPPTFYVWVSEDRRLRSRDWDNFGSHGRTSSLSLVLS